ncbi:MAG: DUF2252 family protein [Candidatus Wallbacteria bacterium]|nr:DUF2252 family protein [Candidatus Wallbacteria bacterium]
MSQPQRGPFGFRAIEERADGGAGKVLDALCDSYTRTLLDPAAAAKVVYNSQEGPKFLRKTIEKAEEGGRPALLAKLTETRGGKPVFKRGDRLFDVPPGTAKAVAAAVEAYGKTAKPSAPSSQLAVKDVVGKLTKGIASVGMDRYLVLAEGPTARPADDLVLEVKEEAESTLGRGVGAEASPFSNEGERYVAGARAVQGDPDRWLGWTRVGDRDFVVREQSPYKTTVELTDLEDGDQWQKFAEVLGALAARSVSRGKGAAAARKALGGKEQEFAHAVKRFAKDYAEQAKEDYTVFKRSLDK